MENIVYALISILIVSLISLIGVLSLSVKLKHLKKILLYLVSFSAGALIGGAMFHLLPESIEELGDPHLSLNIFVLGLLFFFIIEKFIHWRHCHIPTSSTHKHPLGMMNLIGDAIHNFIDGMIIMSSFLVSKTLGISSTIGIALHEIPQEIGDFGVLVHAGYSKKKALLMNFITALSSFLGAFFVIIFSNIVENFQTLLLPFAAGGFIYIATSDLIPELKKENKISKSLIQLFSIVLGLFVMYLFLITGSHQH